MLIKKKKLAKKNGQHKDEVKELIADNKKLSKGISLASEDDIQDSLDALYQDYSVHEPVASSQEHILSEDEIIARAQDLIESKSEELFANFQNEIEQKKIKAEAEISQMLSDAQNQSSIIINEAKTKAEELKADIDKQYEILEKEKQKLEKTILVEKKKAYEEGISKAEDQINEFVRILSGFNKTKEKLVEEIKPQIVSIAISVAKEILDYEVNHNPDLLEEQVSKSIARLVNTKGIMQIYLHPDDIKHADYLDKVLSRLLDSSVRLIFMKDEEVDKGSCIINTQGGRLDSRFSTQIELIKVAFEQYLGHKVDEIDNLNKDLEIIEEPDLEDPEMAKKIIKPNKTKVEPSDEDLDLLEDAPESLIDFSMDDDLNDLLQHVILDEDEGDTKAAKKSKKENFNLDHDDSTDIGANDFANGDDLDLDTELSIDSNSDDEDDGPEMEEFNEFAEDDENLGNDSNFDGSQLDDRFPEY